MLVQLRRVVYLLVLLQCCLSVCLASGGNSHGPEAHASITMAESKLKESIRRADVLIAKRPVCVKEGIESMNDYEKMSKVALDAKKVMDAHIKDIREFSIGTDGKIEVELSALDKQLLEAKAFLMNAGKAVREAMASLEWVGYVRDTCGGLRGSMEEEEGYLRKDVDVFRGFFPEVNKTDEMKRLEVEGDKVIWDLGEEKEKIKKYESNFKGNLTVDLDLVEMGKAVIKARAYLLAFSGVITELRSGTAGKVTKELWRTKRAEIEKNVEVRAKGEKEVFDAEMEPKIKEILYEKKGNMLNEIEKGVARRVEERGKADKAENARNAQEQPRGEVEEKGKKGTKKGKKEGKKERARRATEERGSVSSEDETKGSQESEEPRGVKGKEEAKDLAVGKEGKANEQLGTVVLHIDGSSSPALLHVPLLFLTLMCVLGSILVF